MSKPRGNKTSQAARAERRTKAVELMNAGATPAEIIDKLDTSRTTFWRDLKELTQRFESTDSEAFDGYRRAQLAVFELMERSLLEEKIDPDVAREWRGIRSQISKLLGLNAPTTTVTTNINVETDPALMKVWQRAVYELRHIPEAKLPEFWLRVQPIIAELEEREIVLDASYYPDKPALTGGDHEGN